MVDATARTNRLQAAWAKELRPCQRVLMLEVSSDDIGDDVDPRMTVQIVSSSRANTLAVDGAHRSESDPIWVVVGAEAEHMTGHNSIAMGDESVRCTH
jgi:hypothetical protein